MKRIERMSRAARLTLMSHTMRGAGERLPLDWWDWRRTSNYDRGSDARQALKDAALAAGFVMLEHGHPVVTAAGAEWGKAAWASNNT